MTTRWLKIFEHLLPNARAWRLTADKYLRSFFDGLGNAIGEDVKTFFDEVFEDIDPQKTRALESWEDQFALRSTGLTEQERRNILDATWKALGGQDPRYIQDTIQAAGFDVYVHEWWEPVDRDCGGSINGDVTPIARNPFNYLDDGTGSMPYLMYDGGDDVQDSGSESYDGATQTPVGYPLVNKLMEAKNAIIGDGSAEMMDGSLYQDGSIIAVYDWKQYIMPADEDTYPYYLYIGGQVFPEQIAIQTNRQDEFEDLCLKVCPNEQWLGLLVTYV